MICHQMHFLNSRSLPHLRRQQNIAMCSQLAATRSGQANRLQPIPSRRSHPSTTFGEFRLSKSPKPHPPAYPEPQSLAQELFRTCDRCSMPLPAPCCNPAPPPAGRSVHVEPPRQFTRDMHGIGGRPAVAKYQQLSAATECSHQQVDDFFHARSIRHVACSQQVRRRLFKNAANIPH